MLPVTRIKFNNILPPCIMYSLQKMCIVDIMYISTFKAEAT